MPMSGLCCLNIVMAIFLTVVENAHAKTAIISGTRPDAMPERVCENAEVTFTAVPISR